MPNCAKNCGECGKCIAAHAQIVIDEQKAQIAEQAKAIRNVQRALKRNENREINMGEAWALITEAVAEKPKS